MSVLGSEEDIGLIDNSCTTTPLNGLALDNHVDLTGYKPSGDFNPFSIFPTFQPDRSKTSGLNSGIFPAKEFDYAVGVATLGDYGLNQDCSGDDGLAKLDCTQTGNSAGQDCSNNGKAKTAASKFASEVCQPFISEVLF